MNTSPLLKAAAALIAGTVFGVGLALAGMTDPLKVLGFLDVAGAWDASLLFVLGGAVLTAMLGFGLLRRRAAPLLDSTFHRPSATLIDRPLLLGSALFGIGWGLGGYCPGPAIASLGFNNPEAWLLVPAMLAGAGMQRWQSQRRPAPSTRDDDAA